MKDIISHFANMNLVTTGQGKTLFVESLIAEAIFRGQSVCYIDSKGVKSFSFSKKFKNRKFRKKK